MTKFSKIWKKEPFIHPNRKKQQKRFKLSSFGVENTTETYKASLDAYCKKIGLPFRCNSEDVASNNRRFRDFIQFCLPVRIGMVEGNHRLEGVCRRFYGLQLDGDYRSKFGSEEPPSQNSTMTKPTPIRMIQTPNQNVLNNRLLA